MMNSRIFRLEYLFTTLFLVFGVSLYGQSADQLRREGFQKTIDEFRANREKGLYGNPEVLFIGSSSFKRYIDFDVTTQVPFRLQLG